METVIRHGKVITAEKSFQADIGIDKGRIEAIAPKIEIEAGRVIDARGMLIIPGAIDAHVHFQLPIRALVSSDDFENGTKAAACGGVTTIIDFATQKKGESLKETIAKRRAEADGNVAIDYSLHASPTDWTAGTKKEIPNIISGGITSFKLYMTYAKQGLKTDDANLYWSLEKSAEFGALIMVHAESDGVLNYMIERYHNAGDMRKYGARCHILSRPNVIEAEAIQRAAFWANAAGGKLYIVHMSTAEGTEIVCATQRRKSQVFAETCPQYLLLDDAVFNRPEGHLFATCPQIKKKSDSERLWEGLRDGTISVIATDSCTFTKKQKNTWRGDFTKIPYGIPGVETILPLIYSFGVRQKRISVNKMVAVLSTNPAKLMGLFPQKGAIKIGSDADLVIFDPRRKVTLSYKNLQTNCDWSPYEGFELTGHPHLTLSRGEIVARDGEFIGRSGHGRFLKRGIGVDP